MFTSCHTALGYQTIQSTRNSIFNSVKELLEEKESLSPTRDLNFIRMLIQLIFDYAKDILQILFSGYWEPGFYLHVGLNILIALMFIPILAVISITAVPLAVLVAIPLSILGIAYVAMALTILSDDDEHWYPSYFIMKIREVIEILKDRADWYPGFLFVTFLQFFFSEDFTWFPGISFYVMGAVFMYILLLLIIPQ